MTYDDLLKNFDEAKKDADAKKEEAQAARRLANEAANRLDMAMSKLKQAEQDLNDKILFERSLVTALDGGDFREVARLLAIAISRKIDIRGEVLDRLREANNG